MRDSQSLSFAVNRHSGPTPEETEVTKSTRNSGKSWTSSDTRQLATLAKGNTPTRVIGLKLGRTPGAVQTKASDEGISLKPTNQSPYGTRKS
jgi:hypothetical protein